LTDRTLLLSVLGVPHLLTTSEKTAFRRMLEDIQAGTIISLTRNQRDWVQSRYEHHNLSKYYETHPVPQKVWTNDPPPQKFSWEQNLPLKPPGRK
jgi:hypothetical protein